MTPEPVAPGAGGGQKGQDACHTSFPFTRKANAFSKGPGSPLRGLPATAWSQATVRPVVDAGQLQRCQDVARPVRTPLLGPGDRPTFP